VSEVASTFVAEPTFFRAHPPEICDDDVGAPDSANLNHCSWFLPSGVWAVGILNMHELLAHISGWSSYALATIIMLGVAILVCAAVGCCTSCGEKDDLFHREVY
jgi:hypothetical protein